MLSTLKLGGSHRLRYSFLFVEGVQAIDVAH